MLSVFRHPLLRELPGDHELLGHFEFAPLTRHQRLYEPGNLVDKLYFPESGLVSVLRRDGRRAVQSWCHGSGGRSFVGAFGVFLPTHICTSEYRVVVPGMARVVARDTMKSLLVPGSLLEARVNAIVQILNSAMQQMLLCHSWHLASERIATQLLLVRYALGWDRIPISRQALGNMVGCARGTTYPVIENWVREGIISLSRGIRIRDAPALEKAACGCFDIIMGERDSFLAAAN